MPPSPFTKLVEYIERKEREALLPRVSKRKPKLTPEERRESKRKSAKAYRDRMKRVDPTYLERQAARLRAWRRNRMKAKGGRPRVRRFEIPTDLPAWLAPRFVPDCGTAREAHVLPDDEDEGWKGSQGE